MERYIDKFMRDNPLRADETPADYAERFMNWMVKEQGAFYPGGEAEARKSLHRKALEMQISALDINMKIGKKTLDSGAFICQAAMGALNGMLSHPTRYKSKNESMDWHEAIAVEAVNIAEDLWSELHRKHHI